MRGEFYAAISQLSLERGISRDVLLNSVQEAVKAVYNKTYNPAYEVEVEMDPNTGHANVYRMAKVAGEVRDPDSEVSLAEARRARSDASIGDTVKLNVTPESFGRIAAQMTRQVMLQKIREAEHDTVLKEYAGREGELITGVIARMEAGLVIIELGKAEAIMPRSEQVDSEHYRSGQRLKVLLQKVQKTPKGPQIVVSRRDKTLLRRLFEIEVPEIFNGTVEIKGIARVPGVRSKVAVAARQQGIDPVGSCVGVRGIRVQNVVDEVRGEKIDIIQWHESPEVYIARALSPAQVSNVSLDAEGKTATVIVPERQLSLAIGKDGQNARLAANLTSWRVDIRSAESLMAGEELETADEEDFGADEPEIAGDGNLNEANLKATGEENLIEENPTAEEPVEPASAESEEQAARMAASEDASES